MEIRSLLAHLKATPSDRQVTRDTGLARNTVRRYRQWAREHNLLEQELPSPEELARLLETGLPLIQPPQHVSSVEPFRDLVLILRAQGVECRAIHSRIKERGYTGSYSSVYRFVCALEPREPEAVVRVETPPGLEAQVDFGDAGMLLDEFAGKMRKAWVFVMTLSFSRHQYVEFVFDQKCSTWLGLHARAFTYFGGVPGRIVLDNLKAGIIKASWDEPEVNRSYAEMVQHYGCLMAPCRPATPRHKGKVESGVHYVKRNFLAGREPGGRLDFNRQVLEWCREVGDRIHGTTRKKPLELFEEERRHLKELPLTAYDMAIYKEVKLHRDCHVVFEGSYYSAPFRLIDQRLWLRAGLDGVRLFNQSHELQASHSRAKEPGERHTHPDHLPPHKVPGLLRCRQTLAEQARQVGSCTAQIVNTLLEDSVIDRTHTAGRLLRLAERHSPQRLELACGRALACADGRYTTIKAILAGGLEQEALPVMPSAPAARTFARSPIELLGPLLREEASLWGGGSWN